MAHSTARKARVHVLTISDTRTTADDTSGALCAELTAAAGHEVAGRTILPDDPGRVEEACRELALTVDAILVWTRSS
jgi:molybdopterin adenylyltransferase